MIQPPTFDKNIHIKLSPSCISTYEQCPRRWFYRYIQKYYPEVEEQEFTEFGNFVHDIAEHYKDGCTMKEFKELVSQTLKHYEISETYRLKIIPAVKNLYIYCNQRFKKDDVISRERKMECHYKGKFFLTGKVDIIHGRGDIITVIDWKTSKAEKDHSFQLSFYKLLIELIDLIHVDKLAGEIVYLCAAEKEELLYVSKYVIENDDVLSAKGRIDGLIKTYEKLGSDNIEKWRKKTGPLCKYCDYFKAKTCDGKNNCE